MPTPRLIALLLALVLSLAAAGCGEDEEDQAAPDAPAQEQAQAPEPTPEADLTDTDQRPVVAKPAGDPPAKLRKKDIVRGKGRRAKEGDALTVQYVGVSYSTGEEFDASWNRGEPFTFSLGAGEVIPGWDRGLKGMRVGGRRQLTIPPDLAYGPQGSPPAIGPNETLIFIVDLEDVS